MHVYDVAELVLQQFAINENDLRSSNVVTIECTMSLSCLAAEQKMHSLGTSRPQTAAVVPDQSCRPHRVPSIKAIGAVKYAKKTENVTSSLSSVPWRSTSFLGPTCKERASLQCFAKRSKAAEAPDVGKSGRNTLPQAPGTSLPIIACGYSRHNLGHR